MTFKHIAIKTVTAAVIMLACGASAQAQTFTETFGNAAGRVTNAYVTGFAFRATGEVSNGGYAVMPPQAIIASGAGAYWEDLPYDHTGLATSDATGALMVLNAGTPLSDIYRRDFNVEAGKSYRVSAWRYVVNGNGGAQSNNPLSWSLEVRNTSNDMALVSSGNIASTARATWLESTYDFTVPADCRTLGTPVPARLAITNRTSTNSGNDLYVDDISVVEIPPAAGQDPFCPAPLTPTSVPALDLVGLGMLSLLGAGTGALALRRRKQAQ